MQGIALTHSGSHTVVVARRFGGGNPTGLAGANGAKVMGVLNLTANTTIYVVVAQYGGTMSCGK